PPLHPRSLHDAVPILLERERIPVCAVSGTSMGAIVGGLYAAGYDAAELETLVGSIDWADVLVDDPARRLLPMERKDEDFRHLLRSEEHTSELQSRENN